MYHLKDLKLNDIIMLYVIAYIAIHIAIDLHAV